MLQEDALIFETASIKDALKKLDRTAKKVLLITDNKNKLLGTITDGDIRRYILSGKSLDNDIGEVYNRKPVYVKKEDFTVDLAKNILIENKIELLPIVDSMNTIIDFITWDQLFSKDIAGPSKKTKIDMSVVIMAGGKGSRLEPFTKILPKPLIPVGDKTILEIIIDEFRGYGIGQYYVTLNHKSDMIVAYFNSIEKDYKINFIKENDFLGTAGSLRLLEELVGDVFIVSNCDVIVKADFGDVAKFHNDEKASLTVLSAIQHREVPYGVIRFKEKGEVVDIIEKPEYTVTINAGIYIMNKECLQFIPKKSSFDMTDLIKSLITNKKKVVLYPVNEKEYVDIGQWEEYKKTVDKLQFFR